jgi:peptidyl-prolyl cis-trans isomerase B (cyclophilin B)
VARSVIAVLCLLMLVSCSRDSNHSQSNDPHRKSAAHPARSRSFISFSQKSSEQLKNYQVILKTSLGNIALEFFPEVAPEHVRNFLRLCQMGFYDHTAWHRVARNFVIQGGDMGSREPPLQMAEASGIRRLQPEFSKLKHVAGIVSMARGEEPDSAETSFFICLAPQPVLDNKYTIFGKVVAGMDVVAKISNVPLEGSKPRERVELTGTEILEVAP